MACPEQFNLKTSLISYDLKEVVWEKYVAVAKEMEANIPMIWFVNSQNRPGLRLKKCMLQ